MGPQDAVIRTIKCENEECNKTITFDRKDEKATFENPANSWLRALRLVQTVDQRSYVYCSDVCEIAGAKSGVHNLPQPKTIIEAGNPAAVAAAAAAAEAAKASDQNLKSGTGGPILVP